MKLALGHMRIAAPVFWGMSMREWLCALEGYRMKNGGKTPDPPMSRDTLDDLMERYPDGPRNAS